MEERLPSWVGVGNLGNTQGLDSQIELTAI